MTDPMTTQSAGAPSLPELPKVPEPWTAASTLKCTACGAPYESVRALAPMAGAACLGGYVPAHACKCGNTQFDGTVSYDSPSPAQFTAAHMRDFATAHGLACYEAGSAAAAQAAWQPIATAPENGEFLVYLPGERAKVQHARFRGQLKVIGSNFAFDMTEPTHWMPLPAPPTGEQA